MQRLLFDAAGGPGPAAWFAIALALLGRWVHAFAQGWLLFDLTGSVLQLAVGAGVAALAGLPAALWSGELSARCGPFRLLLGSCMGLILVALVCGALAVFSLLAPWHLWLAAAAYGGLAAVQAPALAAVLGASPEVEQRQSAAARHALLFNALRVIAPWLAACLIPWLGVAACFLFNVLSLLPLLLWARRGSRVLQGRSELRPGDPQWQSSPREFLAGAGVLCVLVLPMAALLPALAHAFGGDPLPVLARLSSGLGAGALAGALMLCVWRPASAVAARCAACTSLVLSGSLMLALAWLEAPSVQLAWSFGLGIAVSSVLGVCVAQFQAMPWRGERARWMGRYAALQCGVAPLAVLLMAKLIEGLGALAVMPMAGAVVLIYAIAWLAWGAGRGRAHLPVAGRAENPLASTT